MRSGLGLADCRDDHVAFSKRKISSRRTYGFISDKELVRAIDVMTFDHGETQILVAGRKRKNRQGGAISESPERCEHVAHTGKTVHEIFC